MVFVRRIIDGPNVPCEGKENKVYAEPELAIFKPSCGGSGSDSRDFEPVSSFDGSAG
jgi:hypothetical protein